MSLLTTDASLVLKNALIASGVTVAIYSNGERPTTALPKEYIEIVDNGYMSSNASEYGIAKKPVLLGVWVRLLSDKTNKKKVDFIVKQFETALLKGITSNNLRFNLSPLQMFDDTRDIASGYSSKQFNINTTITNT